MDNERCEGIIFDGWNGSRRCSRTPWKDGYCKQHHPDTERERREAKRATRDARARTQEAIRHVSECRDAIVEAAINFVEGEPQAVLLKNAVRAFREAQRKAIEASEAEAKL